MGPSLGSSAQSAAALGVILIALLQSQAALADRVQKRAKVAPKAAASPTVALALSGTYTLTKLGTRDVRDLELAKSRATFEPSGLVQVATSCNGFQTRLQARPAMGQILGFGQTIHTQIGCPEAPRQAEATLTRLFRDTANIARAGQTLTFFNTTGIAIAQWTATRSAPVGPERSAPQPGAPAPVRAYFGDYVLSQINDASLAAPSARPVPAPPGMPDVAEAASPSLPSNLQIVSSLPTLFLRDDGRVIGSSGCNQYNSTLVNNNAGSVRFGPVVSTKRACLDQNISRLERDFFNAMREAVRVDVSDRRIDLYRQNGTRSARFQAIGARASAAPSLYGVTWILRRFNNAPVRQTNIPTIAFSGDQASGSTGCNQFGFTHKRQNGRSRFTNGIATEEGCGNRQASDLESRYMSALGTISSITLSATTLTLTSSDNRSILIFDAD